jgi:RNA polymerase sigma-70 factor (subfamily 1)
MAIASRELSATLRSKLDPADLVQDTALDAHRTFSQFEGEVFGQLLAWLRRIILNNAASTRRKFMQAAKRQVKRELSQVLISSDLLVGVSPTPHELLERFEQQVELERCLAALPPDMLTVIILRHRQHLSFPQIGAEMGRSSEAARKLLARAIRRLRLATHWKSEPRR